ncbi:MAG: response regulator transcription factor [Saprospiraceae bacterium]
METNRPIILLAEDDETLGFLLKEYLTDQGFHIDWVKNGAQALRSFKQTSYDLSILDVMMPALDGYTVAELIRNQQPNHPIIFLTAKSMHKDVERGFRAGADDYIKKPVEEEELVARILSVLKRSGANNLTGETQNFEIFQIGDYIFDSKKHLLQYNESIKELTEMESNLLWLLCENKNRLIQREYVLQKMWGRNDFLARKSMDVFISRLRKYLSKDEKIKIVNIHGSGFVLEINAEGE